MYLPSAFSNQDSRHTLRILREHPLAHLICMDADGFPMVSHLPLHVSELDDQGQPRVLCGHLAANNPQVQALQAEGRALVTFMGRRQEQRIWSELKRCLEK